MNNEEKIRKIEHILYQTLGTSKRASDELLFTCPFCHWHNPKLSINMGDKLGKWKCWVCNAKGNHLLSLLRKLHASKDYISDIYEIFGDEMPIVMSTDIAENVQLSLPREFVPLYKMNNDLEFKKAMIYLIRRGITIEDILKHKIGYCKDGLYAGRIIIPSYDSDGKVNYFMARDYRDVSKLKYKNPKTSRNIIGFENQINWNYPVILVEGIFDAIALKRNAIPMFGKFLSTKLREKIMSPNVTDIYVALDNDALPDAIKLSKDLIDNGKNVHLVRFDKKDASELGFENAMEIIRKTKPLKISDLMKLKVSVI